MIHTASQNKTDVSHTLELCYGKLDVFSKTFFPDAVPTPFSSVHRQMLKLLDSKNKLTSVAAPRGLGKTTFARILVQHAILYRDYEFILYVSNSETIAELQTENIKRELRTNREVRRIFGDIAINTDDPEVDDSFSKRAWVAFGNTLVLPRGAGQQVRGLLYKNYRPQLIIVDDLEKRDELENPENRRKIKDWFFSDLLKCVDRYSNKWRILYIDTLKHADSLLQDLLDSPHWASARLEICDDNFNSLVPELISTEEILREVEEHRRLGKLDILYSEYRNLPIAKEDASFREQYFRHYLETDLTDAEKKELENIVIVDPAKSAKMQSADSAIVGIGINYRTGAIYIRDIVHGKMYPDQVYDEMFAMVSRLKVHNVGIEVTGLEEFIKQPILNEMQKRGVLASFEPIWLKARGGSPDGEKGKVKRIGALVPYYRQGYIFHNKAICGVLEAQLLGFPRSGLVDVADATAYLIEMLELGGRYFSSPEEDPEDIENEFAELEYEEPLRNWRTI